MLSVLFAIVLTIPLILSGCGSDASKQDAAKSAAQPAQNTTTTDTAAADKPHDPVNLEVSWWGGDERSAAISAAIKLFEKKYDWIHVTPTFQGFDGYNEKLIVRLSTNKAPDLFFFGTGYTDQLSKDDLLVDFSKRTDLPYYKEVEPIAKPFMTTDKVIGVPAGITNPVLAYDKKIFDDAKVPYPTDNETWVSLGEKWSAIHKALPNVYGAGAWFQSTDAIFLMSKQLGYDPVNTASKPATMSLPDDLMKVWQWNEKLWADGAVTRDQNVQTGFDSANLATAIAYSSGLSSLNAKNPLGFVPLPKKFDDSSKEVYNVPSPAMMWGVAAKNKHVDEAIMLLNFLQTDPDAVKAIGLQIGSPPVKASADLVASGLTQGSVEQQSLDVLKRSQVGAEGFAQPKPPGMSAASDAYLSTLDKYVFKKIDAKEFMKEVQEAMNKAFADAATTK